MRQSPGRAASRPDQVSRPRLKGPALALLFLAGCASGDSARAITADRENDAREMFVNGYEQIDEVFIDPVDLAAMARSGLTRLATLDQNIAVSERPGQILILAGGKVARAIDTPDAGDAEAWGELTAEAVAAARVASATLRNAPNEAVYEAVFDGMVTELDSFSRYASAEDATENRASREGFGGIGVRISVETGEVRVLSVMHYTPAERAGLAANDIVAEVDGRPIGGLDQENVVELLRGPVGSEVAVTILRGEARQRLIVELVRAHVVPETVTYKREGNVGYLRVYSFNFETAESLQKEMEKVRDEIGPRIKGYVLDLRGNPGGLLDQAVEVSDLFLEEGRVVSTRGRHPDSQQYFEASSGDASEGLPVVVLINGDSASASEIVAAALQDDDRAVIVGSNSYGKGTVQTVLRMPNEGELTLTWARFHAPSGYTLDHLGVLPTICSRDATDEGGVTALIQDLRGGRLAPIPTAARNSVDPANTKALDELRKTCPAREEESESDLALALRLLDEPALYSRALALATPRDLAAAAGASP
jgi:carboxyl-terminal processing protease